MLWDSSQELPFLRLLVFIHLLIFNQDSMYYTMGAWNVPRYLSESLPRTSKIALRFYWTANCWGVISDSLRGSFDP
ncbi:hypothetical protein RJ641_009224 [Dillenia turbinata]|uniref:Uncharacterized protein n=1 Tax=Dillenia turbinata TaxID=194707 RepID=A0AAN8VC08_9MAGN